MIVESDDVGEGQYVKHLFIVRWTCVRIVRSESSVYFHMCSSLPDRGWMDDYGARETLPGVRVMVDGRCCMPLTSRTSRTKPKFSFAAVQL
jgi:hypothetical protein